jgi:molecular chaperone GrpE
MWKMSKKNRHHPDNEQHTGQPDPTPAEGAGHPAAVSAVPASEGTPPAQDELAKARQEIEELRDKNLRLLAESQNQQKRTQREKLETLRFAEAEFGRELLVVLDDLARTLEAAKTATDVKAVAEGVRILYEQLLKVLQSRHIRPIEAVGRPFDPQFHEALLQRPSTEHPAGTVMEELARGYQMHERVLRPSRVVVSSGPPPTDENDGKKPTEGSKE